MTITGHANLNPNMIIRYLPPEWRKPVSQLGYYGQVTRRTVLILGFLSFLSIVFESFGVAMMLPIMDFIQAGSEIEALTKTSKIWVVVAAVFEFLGVEISLLALIIVAFTLILLRQGTGFAAALYNGRVIASVEKRLAERCFNSILASDAGHMESFGTGRFVDVIYQQCQRGSKAVEVLATLWRQVVVFVAYGVVMFAANPLAAALAIMLAALAIAIVNRYVVHARRISTELVTLQKDYSQQLSDRYRAWRLIKISNSLKREIEEFRTWTGRLLSLAIRLVLARGMVQLIVMPFIALFALSALYLTVNVIGASVATITLFVIILLRLVPAAEGISRLRQGLANIGPSLERVVSVIHEAEERVEQDNGTRECQALRTRIRFDKVSFHYPQGEHPALEQATLVIPAQKMTAIMGPSGAGKSTLVDLLPRLINPQAGAIIWDEDNLDDFSLSSLREQIAYVPQEPMIFDVSVAQNVRYARPNASQEEIEAACRLANAHEFIQALPDGYETNLGEAGSRLSGGQRQRLVLARALVERVSLLVLDEPTSALDYESEQKVQAAIENLVREAKMTVIVIAHRLSTVRNANHVVVLREGQVVETGRPAELARDDRWFRQILEQSDEAAPSIDATQSS
jgi:ABC-type multidrug transport system fused ATPase/permease subunit